MRTVIAAASGALLLAGCAAGPPQSGAAATGTGTADLTARAQLIEYACGYMKDPAATVRGLGRDLSDRGKYPDADTAAYAARDAISEGCPQYADR